MSYTRHSAYRQASATSWTRIDMLLALYDATLLTLEQGREAVRASNQPLILKARARCLALITELASGIDVEQGDLPQNVHRLLTFCLTQTNSMLEQDWTAAISIASTLRESFAAIRDEAAAMEQAGQIPALQQMPLDCTVAVG